MQFHEIAYQIIIHEKRISVKSAAIRLELSPDALYARLRGRNPFRPWEMKELMSTIPDIRFASWFLSGTNFVPIDKLNTKSGEIDPDDTLRKTVLMMLIDASEAAEQIEKALLDNRIDLKESALIRENIAEAERAIATLREHVRQLTR